MLYVLVYSPPKGVERKYVLPRGGPKPRVPVVWRRRNILVRAPLHQTQHHRPTRAWAWRHPLGVVSEPSTGCIPYVPPVGGWGRLGASSWPQIRRWDRRRCAVLADLWATGRARNPLDFFPLGGAHQSAWSLYIIHYARPYTAQKVSGGCVTAISGSASEFAEDT